jgi:hypothetical protein
VGSFGAVWEEGLGDGEQGRRGVYDTIDEA